MLIFPLSVLNWQSTSKNNDHESLRHGKQRWRINEKFSFSWRSWYADLWRRLQISSCIVKPLSATNNYWKKTSRVTITKTFTFLPTEVIHCILLMLAQNLCNSQQFSPPKFKKPFVSMSLMIKSTNCGHDEKIMERNKEQLVTLQKSHHVKWVMFCYTLGAKNHPGYL